jgi:predicted nucleic-acid-binding protein
VEKSKTNRKAFKYLKASSVEAQLFELASELRSLELKYHPETEEQKEAKKIANRMNLLFRMVELNVERPLCWLIYKAIKLNDKKKGNFSLEDASKLIADKKRLFDE